MIDSLCLIAAVSGITWFIVAMIVSFMEGFDEERTLVIIVSVLALLFCIAMYGIGFHYGAKTHEKSPTTEARP
jgi:hypothetical protein